MSFAERDSGNAPYLSLISFAGPVKAIDSWTYFNTKETGKFRGNRRLQLWAGGGHLGKCLPPIKRDARIDDHPVIQLALIFRVSHRIKPGAPAAPDNLNILRRGAAGHDRPHHPVQVRNIDIIIHHNRYRKGVTWESE